ncbi:MAG: DUF4091 domain-containing protein [Armatimonadetes bacterium]|nr:DUF4091 domain-containing protein [Armatimonadota bacterium]
MMRMKSYMLVAVCAMAWSVSGYAETVVARWDFETEDPVEFGAGSEDYVLNFKGLTEETPHSGKKCFKMDITFPSGGLFSYWQVPIKPLSMRKHRLMLRGYMRVVQHDTRSISFGYRMPGWNCEPFSSNPQLPDQWVEQGYNFTERLLRFDEEPLLTLDGWYLSFVGLQGRSIVYLDDVELVEDAQDSELDAKVDADETSRRQLMGSFQIKLKRLQSAFAAQPPAFPGNDGTAKCDAALREALAARLSATADLIAAAADPPPRVLLSDLRDDLTVLANGVRSRPALRKYGRAASLVAFAVPPLSNVLPNPRDIPISGVPCRRIEITACPGQDEPACIALWSGSDVHDLTLSVTDLQPAATSQSPKSGTTGRRSKIDSRPPLPATTVDFRLVKSWYSLRDPLYYNKSLLTPELLLKKDDLVAVDESTRKNTVPPVDKLRDAPDLQPFAIQAGTVRLLWLTAHLPRETRPGEYVGRLRLLDGTQPLDELNLVVRVLPFALEQSGMTWGMFYRGIIDSDKPSLASDHKTETQYEADMRTWVTHGMGYPTFYSTGSQQRLLQEMQVRNRVGLPGDFALLTGGCSSGADIGPAKGEERTAAIQRFRQYVRGLLEVALQGGYRTVSIWGTDEAPEEVVSGELDAIAVAHEEGALAHRSYWSKLAVGDKKIDLVITGFGQPREVIDEMHRAGSRVLAYSTPYGWCKEPYTFRLHYGLALWRSGYDGGMDYAYQDGDNVWDSATNGNVMAMCYPTAEGVIETTRWEGIRAGIDDCRYLATLKAAIARAGKDPRRNRLARQAAKWVEGELGAAIDEALRPTVRIEPGKRPLWIKPEYLDLDAWRGRMAEWIVRLNGSRSG